jgi:hypothetical protein
MQSIVSFAFQKALTVFPNALCSPLSKLQPPEKSNGDIMNNDKTLRAFLLL